MAIAFYDGGRLPVDIERGATGGPMFSTSIAETAAGREARNQNWSSPRYKWQFGFGTMPMEDYRKLVSFFNARRGSFEGFRFKDWSDFSAFIDPDDYTDRNVLTTNPGSLTSIDGKWRLTREFNNRQVIVDITGDTELRASNGTPIHANQYTRKFDYLEGGYYITVNRGHSLVLDAGMTWTGAYKAIEGAEPLPGSYPGQINEELRAVKYYDDVSRVISKPVEGSVSLYNAAGCRVDLRKNPGADSTYYGKYRLDPKSGRVQEVELDSDGVKALTSLDGLTFKDATPYSDSNLTGVFGFRWSGEFDVPVRFVEDQLSGRVLFVEANKEDKDRYVGEAGRYGAAEIPNLSVVELHYQDVA